MLANMQRCMTSDLVSLLSAEKRSGVMGRLSSMRRVLLVKSHMKKTLPLRWLSCWGNSLCASMALMSDLRESLRAEVTSEADMMDW